MPVYEKKTLKIYNMPNNFDQTTIRTITRIEENSRVIGLMYIYKNFVEMCTLPTTVSQTLSSHLPGLTSLFQRAITEIDVLDDLIAYRIITNKKEISVVVGNEFAACVVHKLSKLKPKVLASKLKPKIYIKINFLTPLAQVIMKIISNLLKDSLDEWLVKTTDTINKINPIVDRMMEDDSVEGVIMTNKQGAPILTNINLVGATNYGVGMKNLGQMTQMSAQEIDPFDEVLVLRILTKKIEVMVYPHREFNIIVMQHARVNKKITKTIKEKAKL